MPSSRFHSSRAMMFLGVALTLGACSVPAVLDNALSGGTSAPAIQTSGVVVGDEPYAVTAGRTILSQGGSAADAVTAMFFALSVTYPVSAGLGGGGVCIASNNGRIQEFDFLPRAAKANGAYAVPGAVAGFSALQSAFGILPWQRDVSPGETYAATGFLVSHALSQRLATAQAVIRQDAALSAEFLDASGAPRAEGTLIRNVALSQTLATIRLSGPDGFYRGAVAAEIAQHAAGGLSLAELAEYRSTQAAARMMAAGGYAIAIPGAQTGAGAFAAALMASVPPSADPEQSIVTAVRAALQKFGITSLPQDLGATGFAAVDARGQAVACAVTMNGPLGLGKSVGGTGITLAASPSAPASISSAFLTPLLARDSSGKIVLAGAGAGGPNGTAAIIYAALKQAGGRQLGRPSDLRSTGVAPYATVNAISCDTGACVPLPDPGGNGLGASADAVVSER